jgi:predicted enzyme related to lactoylglutathione lyase
MKTSMLKFILILFLAGFGLNSCDSGINFPPVTETATGVYHPGQFVWHDLATPNPYAAMDFYKAVFGWEFNTLGSGEKAYHVILSDGKPIGGIFKLAAKFGTTGEWVGSISVKNVDEAVAFNTAQGGTTIFKAAYFKGRGNTALVQDPQGAIVAFLHAEGGDPDLKKEAAENTWLWNELWTNDMEASRSFYKTLCDYDEKSILGAKAPYVVFEKDGKKYSGVLGNPVEGSRSSWMPYIRVSDVDATVKKAVAAGAKMMMEPNNEIRNGSVAVLLDPIGAQFTIQKWPIH